MSQTSPRCIMHDYDWLRLDTTLLGLVQHQVPLFISFYNRHWAAPGVSKNVWRWKWPKMPHRQNAAAGAVRERVGRLFPSLVTVTMGWSLSGVWLGWQECLKSYQTRFSVTRLPGVCLLSQIVFLHWYGVFTYIVFTEVLRRCYVRCRYMLCVSATCILHSGGRVSKYLSMLDMLLSSQGWPIPIWRPKIWIWCPQGTCFRKNKSGRTAACHSL